MQDGGQGSGQWELGRDGVQLCEEGLWGQEGPYVRGLYGDQDQND